MLFRSKIK